MADYGIRIINPTTGSIQIDQNYYNLELLSIESAVTIGSFNISDPNQNVNTPYESGFSGIEVIAPITDYILFNSVYYVSERLGNRYKPNRRYFVTNAPVGTLITFYRFGFPVASSPIDDTYGVIVKSQSGSINFHSSRQYLNIPAVYTGAYVAATPPSFTLSSGRTYAIGSIKWGGRREIYFDRWWVTPGGLAVYNMYERGFMYRVQSNIVTSQEGYYVRDNEILDLSVNMGSGSFDVTDRTYGLLVADVTNFVNPV